MENNVVGNVTVDDITLGAAGIVAPVEESKPVMSAELAGVEEGLVEKINNMEKLTKDELLTVNKQMADTIRELSERVAHFPAEKDKLVEDINSHYKIVLDNKNRTINYFIKKFTIIEDLVRLEKED